MFNLQGKTAIVTGGRNGNLGSIWVETLQEAGVTVHTIDLPEQDITDPKTWGDVYHVEPDILVNNAAIDNPPGSSTTFFGKFMEIMAVNIGGAVKASWHYCPIMKRSGGGVVVNVGSIQGYGGADWHNYEGDFEKPVGYNCSKAAMMQLSRSITTQYGRHGIRSVTISFGCVDTPKIPEVFASKYLSRVPMGRMISKQSLKQTLIYACCCEDFAGEDFRVDGGLGAWA